MSRGGCWAITNQLVKLLVHCLEEGSKKSSRNLVYEVYYFRTLDAVEIVTGVAWINFDYITYCLLQGSEQVASPVER